MFVNFLFTLLIITLQYRSTLTTECIINTKGWCEFRYVRATNEAPLFQPSWSGTQKVNRIFFTECQIPVMTTELCSSFPELWRLDLERASLSNVNETALHNCGQLSYISFYNNNLQTVHRDIFKQNTGLRFISFSCNALTHIDMSIFSHLYLLEELALDNNKIVIIDFGLAGDLPKMSILHLGSNQLIEMNEVTILNRYSNLTKVYMEDNLFLCLRVPAILELFRSKNVTVGRGLAYQRTDVHYERKLVQNVDCLESRAYNEMLVRRIGTGAETSVQEVIDVEVEPNSESCWYIGGALSITLVLVIIMLSLCLCKQRRTEEMANGDYYYDYRTQTQLKSESRF